MLTLLRGSVAFFTPLLVLLWATPLHSQESRWQELNAQVMDLYQQGKYAEDSNCR